MSISNTVNIPRSPFVDLKTGLVSQEWLLWLLNLTAQFIDFTIVPTTAGGTGLSVTPNAGAILVGNGTDFALKLVNGSATMDQNALLTLSNTGVTAGSYLSADITVGADGRLTAASSGIGGPEIILTDAASITPVGANDFFLQLTNAVGASRTMNLPSGLVAGTGFPNFEVKQPASGGPCTITWASGFKWGLGGQSAAPIGSTVNSASDFYSCKVQQDGNLHCVLIGQPGPTGPTGPTGAQGVAGPAGSGNGVNLQTGTTYTYVVGDSAKLVSHSNAAAIAATLPQATGSFASPFVFDVENRGVGTLTITPTTSTIDGAATLSLATNQGCRIFSDGTNWYTQRGIGSASGSVTMRSFTTDGVTATSTASLAFVNMTAVTTSIPAVVGDRLLIEFSGSGVKTGTADSALYRFFLNAANPVGALVLDYPALNIASPIVIRAVRTVVAGDLTAGSVPITTQWKNNAAGTINLINSANGLGVLTVHNQGP